MGRYVEYEKGTNYRIKYGKMSKIHKVEKTRLRKKYIFINKL